MKIILLGAPGSGKGTQADVICEKYQIPHISTGNIIREALKSGSEAGLRAKATIDEGHLVPDDTVIEIIRERLAQEDCANGYVLDGFPRTIPQAGALDQMGIDINIVLNLSVKDGEIIRRLSGRRTCAECGAVYHFVYNKPEEDGVCDKCSGTLIQRRDDQIETIGERLHVYHRQTEPLIEFYQRKGILVTISGQEEVADTTRLVLAALEAYNDHH